MQGTRDDYGYSLGRGISSQVARRIRDLAGQRRISLSALARSTDIPSSHIYDLISEEARRCLQRWQIVAIAHVLGTTEQDLLQHPLGGALVPKSPSRVPPLLEELVDRHAEHLTHAEAKRLLSLAPNVEQPEAPLPAEAWEGIAAAILGRPLGSAPGRTASA